MVDALRMVVNMMSVPPSRRMRLQSRSVWSMSRSHSSGVIVSHDWFWMLLFRMPRMLGGLCRPRMNVPML